MRTIAAMDIDISVRDIISRSKIIIRKRINQIRFILWAWIDLQCLKKFRKLISIAVKRGQGYSYDQVKGQI